MCSASGILWASGREKCMPVKYMPIYQRFFAPPALILVYFYSICVYKLPFWSVGPLDFMFISGFWFFYFRVSIGIILWRRGKLTIFYCRALLPPEAIFSECVVSEAWYLLYNSTETNQISKKKHHFVGMYFTGMHFTGMHFVHRGPGSEGGSGRGTHIDMRAPLASHRF